MPRQAPTCGIRPFCALGRQNFIIITARPAEWHVFSNQGGYVQAVMLTGGSMCTCHTHLVLSAQPTPRRNLAAVYTRTSHVYVVVALANKFRCRHVATQ